MEGISIKGSEFLDETQKHFLDKIAAENYEKLKRQLKNDVLLKIVIKVYESAGKKQKSKKYSINAEINSAAVGFEASDSDWDFNKTIHSVLNKLKNEIEHRFHVSEQGRE